MDPRRILIYDAECRLCVTSKGFLERWDRLHQIKFLPFQSQEAEEIIPDMAGREGIDAMRYVDGDHISIGVDAFRRMLPVLPLGRLLSVLFYLPGFQWCARSIYRVLAKHRYKWFGTC
ncbi:MAG: thiol-disulfide oxidoreductase DCC family protein [Nitrospiria bacterium]